MNAVSCEGGRRTNPILDKRRLSASRMGLLSDSGLTGDASLNDLWSGGKLGSGWYCPGAEGCDDVDVSRLRLHDSLLDDIRTGDVGD